MGCSFMKLHEQPGRSGVHIVPSMGTGCCMFCLCCYQNIFLKRLFIVIARSLSKVKIRDHQHRHHISRILPYYGEGVITAPLMVGGLLVGWNSAWQQNRRPVIYGEKKMVRCRPQTETATSCARFTDKSEGGKTLHPTVTADQEGDKLLSTCHGFGRCYYFPVANFSPQPSIHW